MNGQTPVAAVHDRFVTLNGIRFHYRDWGEAGAPPLLLLHGITGLAHGWDTVARALCDRFRVLALDLRGHGETGYARDYTWDRWPEDVEAFAQSLALETFSIVGHSLGGLIATIVAARHPRAVARLVIVDIGPPPETAAPPPPPRGPLAGLRDVFDDHEHFLRTAQRQDPYARTDELRHAARHNLIRRADGRSTLRWDPVLRAPDFLFPLPDLATQWRALRTLACPTLVIKGARSAFSRDHAEAMVRTIPDAALVETPDAGHAVHWANPDAFIAAVRRFLLKGDTAPAET